MPPSWLQCTMPPDMANGFFITLEGLDGCGKTTAAEGACEYLKRLGRNVVHTREPGGTWLGERLREILLSAPEGEVFTASEEALLFSASRAVHTREVILPALRGGADVVCDRYLDSTFAYQGVRGGLEFEELEALAQIATGGVSPNLTLLLDLQVEDALGRRREGGDLTRIDRKSLEYHSEVRERFLLLAERHPNRIKVVDSSGSREETMLKVELQINEFLVRAVQTESEGS